MNCKICSPVCSKTILAWVWANRMDWFFGVDRGIYYDPDEPALIADGFLSLAVDPNTLS
jgi:hypothetical protein